jgi:hypothetical protein
VGREGGGGEVEREGGGGGVEKGGVGGDVDRGGGAMSRGVVQLPRRLLRRKVRPTTQHPGPPRLPRQWYRHAPRAAVQGASIPRVSSFPKRKWLTSPA